MLAEIERLAAGQDGLVTRGDVLAAGVPPDTLTGWVRSGRLSIVHRGVYALAGQRDSARQQARAAVFAARHPAAAASFQTAALVHRIGVLATAGTPHVTLPSSVHRPSRPTLVVHRADLDAKDVVDLDGLRVTAVLRTVRDLFMGGDRLAAVWAGEAALRAGSVCAPALDELLEHCTGRPHAARMRQWRALVDPRSESPLETAVRLLLVDAGFPTVVPQHPVRTPDGHLVARLDLAWPAARIGIEADGKEPHSGLRPVFTDRWRTNALVGWQLLRFTWYDVLRRPAYVVATARAHHRGAA